MQTVVSNVNVYGLSESVKASKYPMATDLMFINSAVTPTVSKLAGVPTGTGHDNFIRGIIVQFDLTFTNKAWVEAERYTFFNIVSSQSTMHRITKFDLDKAYIEHVHPQSIELMKRLIKEYNDEPSEKKYLQILYTNPAGFKLTARISTNYQQLKTIYFQRRNHRLPEWQEFCDWVETLPYFQDWILKGK